MCALIHLGMYAGCGQCDAVYVSLMVAVQGPCHTAHSSIQNVQLPKGNVESEAVSEGVIISESVLIDGTPAPM